MKKLYILIATLICICFSFNVVFAEVIDIQNHWAEENINRMIVNGNVEGYPDNTFKPNNEITKLEFLKILFNSMNINLIKNGLNEWPDYYIDTAKEYGITDNYYEKLTRYEAVEIISKLVDLKKVTASGNKFKDLDKKYKDDVLKLNKLNIINGYEDKTFRGNNTLTRAEAITIVSRACMANRKIINSKKYEIDEKYTNTGNKKSEIEKIKYSVKNNKIYFRDDGRFSYIKDYTIDEKYITNKKLLNIIETLLSEDSYTAVFYVPSKYVINQVIIKYGQDDNYINRGLEYFSFTYYEDKLYDLQRVTLQDDFSNECYMKIELKKLWNDLYEFKNSNYIDEIIEDKLLKVLKIEFGKSAADILNYMKEKYIENINQTLEEDAICEQKTIGNYIVNFYKTDATSLEFYFEKLSSN